MSRVAAALAVEVYRRVTWVVGRFAWGLLPELEALERRPGLEQRAIHREVFVRKQLQAAGLRHHAGEKLARHVVLQQPRPVAREGRMVEARLGHIQIEEPAEQQVVVEL